MRPIIPSPLHFTYRNRITVHAEGGADWIFPARFSSPGRRRTLPDRDGGSESRAGRLADARCSRRSLHAARKTSPGHRAIFSQTNDAVANALRDLIVRSGAVESGFAGGRVLRRRLFRQSPASTNFERVVGIDWDRFAIAAAKENATAKEIYIAGDVESGLRSAMENCDRDKTTLLADPPATGLTARVCETIVDLAPATFIYISCNPSTLARDLADFQPRFEIKSVTPLDMFPQTAEIEVAAELRRRG